MDGIGMSNYDPERNLHLMLAMASGHDGSLLNLTVRDTEEGWKELDSRRAET